MKLSEAETKRIFQYCEAHGVSISNLFSAIMQIIKHKNTLSTTNSVGLLIHNRNTKKEKSSTGIFSRVLPMIVDTDPEQTVQDYLEKFVESLNLLKHRKYPYDYIVENSGNKKV